MLSLAGLTMVAGGVASIPIRRMIKRNRDVDGIEVEKMIEIDVLLEEVYRFWSDYENLPRFMSHVLHVKAMEGGRPHWRAGKLDDGGLEWDTITTSQVPNELLSWRSTGDAPIKASGYVRFRRTGRGGTRLRGRNGNGGLIIPIRSCPSFPRREGGKNPRTSPNNILDYLCHISLIYN